jgi:hypothetical protein
MISGRSWLTRANRRPAIGSRRPSSKSSRSRARAPTHDHERLRDITLHAAGGRARVQA